MAVVVPIKSIDRIETRKALSSGDTSKAGDLATMDFVEKLSISGSPGECTEKIKSLEAQGLTHVVILALDSEMMGHYAKRGTMPKITGIPTFKEMTKLINREIMPHFQ